MVYINLYTEAIAKTKIYAYNGVLMEGGKKIKRKRPESLSKTLSLKRERHASDGKYITKKKKRVKIN